MDQHVFLTNIFNYKTVVIAILLGIGFANNSCALPFAMDIGSAANQGNYKSAESMLKEVLQEKPSSARTHYELGQVLARENKLVVSRQELLEAQRIDPLNLYKNPEQFNSFLEKVSVKTTESRVLNSTCSLKIDGSFEMRGKCYFNTGKDEDEFDDLKLRIRCIDGTIWRRDKFPCAASQAQSALMGVFGSIERDAGVATLCWNAGTKVSQTCYLGLTRKGACWSNPTARSQLVGEKTYDVEFCARKITALDRR
jgi:tetratricopeptide (TPR) repeat protein